MNKRTIDYVSELFKLRFPQYYYHTKKEEGRKILYDVCRANEMKIYSVDEVTNGLADDTIVQLIEQNFKEKRNDLWVVCENLRKNVIGVISEIDFLEENDMNDYIINNIVAKLVVFYDYHELNAGGFVEKIKYEYNVQKLEFRHLLLTNISRVVNLDIDLYESVDNGISQSDIEIYVLEKMYPDVSYGMIMDLKQNKYDDRINKLIREYMHKNKKPKVDVVVYVADTIRKYDFTLNDKDIEYYTNRIVKILRNRGMFEREITDISNVQVITDCFDELKRRRNSIKEAKEFERQEAERIKYETRKRWIQGAVCTLLLVATIAAATLLVKFGVESYRDWKEDKQIVAMFNRASKKLGGDRYYDVHTKYSDNFVSNGFLIADDYEYFDSFGENYKHLSFFQCYMNVKADKLAIMDAMLIHVQRNFDIDVGTNCFLQFMYDRLVELGCEEIKDEKYVNVISEYKDVAISCNGTDKTPMDCMNKDQITIIQEIRDYYIKYSTKYCDELSGIVDVSTNGYMLNTRRNV